MKLKLMCVGILSAALLVGCTAEPKPLYDSYLSAEQAPPALLAEAQAVLVEGATVRGFVKSTVQNTYLVQYSLKDDPTVRTKSIVLSDELKASTVFEPR